MFISSFDDSASQSMITVVGNIFHLVWYFYITVSWVVKDFHLQSADTLICVRNNWIIVFILLHYTLLLFDMVQKLSPELPQPVHLPETHCGSDSNWLTYLHCTSLSNTDETNFCQKRTAKISAPYQSSIYKNCTTINCKLFSWLVCTHIFIDCQKEQMEGFVEL